MCHVCVEARSQTVRQAGSTQSGSHAESEVLTADKGVNPSRVDDVSDEEEVEKEALCAQHRPPEKDSRLPQLHEGEQMHPLVLCFLRSVSQ